MAAPTLGSSSAQVTVDYQHRTLVVSGSSDDDRITVKRRGTRVTVTSRSDVLATHQATTTRGYIIKGRQGDDRISMSDRKHRRQRASLYGGPGDDRLVGATGGDTLDGGTGEDVMVQSRGANFMYGGSDDDTYRLEGDRAARVTIVEFLPGGIDTIDLSRSSVAVQVLLYSAGSSGGTNVLDISLRNPVAMENAIGGTSGDNLAGNPNDNVLEGGGGGDVFSFFGESGRPIGDDTITDFDRVLDGDSVDLPNNNFVHSGLGTSTVTIWDGYTDFGTITATNGHLWTAEDFA